MKTITKIKALVILLGVVIFLVIAQGAMAQSNTIVVIVHPDNPIAEMTAGKAKLYYLRKVKKRWPEINKNIKPVDMEGTSSRGYFCTKVLGMSESEMDNYFTQREFSNAEKPPIRLSSEDEIIRYVSENPGAIGYVSQSAYKNANSSVKGILSI